MPKKKATPQRADAQSKLTSVRIPADIAARIEKAAQVERRSVSNFLVMAASDRADKVLGDR